MGWLKKAVSGVTKFALEDIGGDKLLPEQVKSFNSKVDRALGGYVHGGAFDPVSPEASSAVDADTTVEAPAISQEEAESVSAKRLARLGRYFTSPIGVLSTASTGSQKVFS